MKTLYLIRHAKSSWADVSLSDFDRPLNERGEKDAPRMAKRLREREVTPHLMVSSPAKRAVKTCKAFCKVLGYPKEKIKEVKALYHASDEGILEVLRQINNKHEVVFLFGHNPGLTEFANRLFNEGILNVPTTGIVAGKLKADTWDSVSFGCGAMEFFDFPKNG